MNELKDEMRLNELEKMLNEEGIENSDIVQIILAQENKPIIEKKMRKRLLQNTKEENIDVLLDRLKENFDFYTFVYGMYLPFYKEKVHHLDENLEMIVEDTFTEFELTNCVTETSRNREQVEELATGGMLWEECHEFIEGRLIELSEDGLIEAGVDLDRFKTLVFGAFMINMLYFESGQLSSRDYHEFIEKTIGVGGQQNGE